MELGCAREGYFSCSPLVRVELARVPVPLGIFAIFQQTMGARVLGTVLAVDIVVVGERHKRISVIHVAGPCTGKRFFGSCFSLDAGSLMGL